MLPLKGSRLFDQFDRREYLLCCRINQSLRYRPVKGYFTVVSRLGDGWLWYALILALPVLSPAAGLPLALLCAATGLASTLIYKLLKHIMIRERPFISFPAILCGTAPLDRYSFPSGHSLHAACFTTLIFPAEPWLGLAILPFTLSVFASRVVLGLHYPTDVVAGALIGVVLALASSALFGWWVLSVAV